MQKMKPATLQKCLLAVSLVYEKGYTLRRAAKAVGISSQTLYTYRDDYLSADERALLRETSKQNASRR